MARVGLGQCQRPMRLGSARIRELSCGRLRWPQYSIKLKRQSQPGSCTARVPVHGSYADGLERVSALYRAAGMDNWRGHIVSSPRKQHVAGGLFVLAQRTGDVFVGRGREVRSLKANIVRPVPACFSVCPGWHQCGR